MSRPEPAGRATVRRRLSRIVVRGPRRRDRRHRRRLRQRPERAASQALSGERAGRAAPTMVRIDGRPVGSSAPSGRARSAWHFVPGGAPRPRRRARHVAGRERPAHAATGASACSRRGLIRGGAATRFAERVIERFDVQDAGAERPQPAPVRRQPAEVHRRPRDRCRPERAGRRPADLGRRCRRRRASARRCSTCRRRRGGAGGLAGARRAVRDHRPPGRDHDGGLSPPLVTRRGRRSTRSAC